MGWQDAPIVQSAGSTQPAWASAPIVQSAAPPKEGDPVPAGGIAPEGFYAVTGDDGKQTLRHESGLYDVMRALSDLPGVGMAERVGQGAVRLGGKAASGIAGMFGGDVRGIQGAVNEATELPPSNDPLVQSMGTLQQGVSKVVAPVDRAVENLPAGPQTAIKATEEAIPDIAAVLGLRGAPGGMQAAADVGKTSAEAGQAAGVRAADAATPNIARSTAEVGKAAGYRGLKTRADMMAPGNQAVTDVMISQDAGIVPGQHPSVAALQNGIRVGPARVYRQAEHDIPQRLTMRNDPLEEDLRNLPNQVSDLPRSPDVAALQETMLSHPDFSRDTLFANIREARERAKTLWQADDPDKQALGDAYHSLAGAYEDFAGRQLDANPDAEVSLADWQAARTQMAKNYQAQGALRGPQGAEHFNPQAYARIAEKDPGLLTGNAAIVGHVAKGLPTSAPAGFREAIPEIAGVGLGGAAAEGLGHLVGVPGGGTLGGLAGHYALAPAIRARLGQLMTRGDLNMAATAQSNPALSYFRNQGQMPPGWNLAPSSPLPPAPLQLPSPSMVNAGGGATTPSTLESLGLTPDVQAAGAAHPGAARLADLRARLAQPPERPAAPVDFQGPQKWGDFSIAPQVPPAAPQGGIPLENVLEQGGTQRPPVGAPAVTYRPPAKSPKQPNVRTPPGAPEITEQVPPGPSPAQLAFRNKLAADRLRKVAGDMRLEGPGGATGSPADRVRAALDRQQRGY